MADAIVWKNVIVDMQSAIAAAKTITQITKANPGVVTSTAHGFTNGEFVYLEVAGMSQLNEKVVRVANVTSDTFELEGINTTLFKDFTSGTAQVITFGSSITTATNINASGGDIDRIDVTTIHDDMKKEMPGMTNAISYSMDHIWDATNEGQAAMMQAADVQAKRAFKFQFGSGGKIMVFAGYVGFSGLPGGQAQGVVTTTALFTMNTRPSFYSS